MKKIGLLVVIVALAAAKPASPPEARISNGIIDATIFLPDSTDGYYRGSRFDWSGVMPQLTWKNHQYFGQWFKEYNPTLHDAIQGPVEAFDPIGYESASAGGTFVKIGIGVLKKTDDSPHSFAKYYPVVKAGVWKVTPKSDRVSFVHTLKDPVCSYVYSKTILLKGNKPEMVIEHSLRNTGSKTIETSTFNHNFFMLDKQATGPEIAVIFPFEYTGAVNDGMERLVQFKGKELNFLKDLGQGDRVLFRDLTAGSPSAYDIRIENRKSKASVHITGDKSISRFVFWCAPTTVCPEPYIKLTVEPGKELTWTTTYEFYEAI